MTVTDVVARVEQLRGHLGMTRTATTATSGAAFAATLGSVQGGPVPTRTAPASHPGTDPGQPATAAYPALRPAALTGAAPAAGKDAVSGVPYADLFNAAGARHGVSPKLLAAVAKIESGYQPKAVSPAGARGLMQLMPGTARGLGVADPFDPAQAVEGAAKLLASHLKEFGSLDLALAAYNAGGGAVRKHGGIPPSAETQAYVPKVKAALAALGGGR